MRWDPGRTFFAAMWAVTVLLNAHVIAPAPVFPQLMEAYGVGAAAAGALLSVVLLAAILTQIPAAAYIDRVDNRTLIVVCVLGLNLVSLPALLWPQYGPALVSRLLTGAFVPLIFVGTANVLSAAYPTARAQTLGTYLSSPPAGYALGTFLTPHVPPLLGLFAVYAVYALPMLVLLPLVLWSSSSLGEGRAAETSSPVPLAAFRSRELWRLGLAFACTYGLYIFFTSWTPSFLVREAGVPLAVGGALAALVPALGVLARPAGGHLAATAFRADRRGVLLLSFLALLPLSLVWLSPASLGWAVLLLPLAGFFIQLPFAVYYAFAAQVLPERLRGGGYTFMTTASLVGGVATPYLAGVLVDASGSFGPAFLFAALLAAAGLVLAGTTRER